MTSLNRKYLEKLNFRQLRKTSSEDARHLQALACNGPLFAREVLQAVERLPTALPKPLVKWLAANHDLSKPISTDNLIHIKDWVLGDAQAATDIVGMDLDQAMLASEAWHRETFQIVDTGEYNTKHVKMAFPDKWTIVEIKDHDDLKIEGDKMGHCAGGGGYKPNGENCYIYSLRDAHNKPHATIEVSTTNTVTQVRGKQNAAPIEQYNPYLVRFFCENEMTDGLSLLTNPVLTEDDWDLLVSKATDSTTVMTLRWICCHNSLTRRAAYALIEKLTDWKVHAWVARNTAAPIELTLAVFEKADITVNEGIQTCSAIYQRAQQETSENKSKLISLLQERADRQSNEELRKILAQAA